MPGTWIYDRQAAILKELHGDEPRAELEYMPSAELPATPIAKEMPVHGHPR